MQFYRIFTFHILYLETIFVYNCLLTNNLLIFPNLLRNLIFHVKFHPKLFKLYLFKLLKVILLLDDLSKENLKYYLQKIFYLKKIMFL